MKEGLIWMKRVHRAGVLGAALLVPATFGGAFAQSPAPVRGGEVTIGCPDNGITNLDPAVHDGGTCQRDAYRALFNTLIRIDQQGNVQPELAKSWATSEDGAKITFELRDDVAFADGAALDANAVVFSYERQVDPATLGTGATQIRNVFENVAATGPHTVTFTLSKPNSSIFVPLGQAWVLPILNPASVKDGSIDPAIAGTGPFLLDSYQPGGEASFKRNPHYFEQASDGDALPYLETMKVVGLADASARYLNVASGDMEYVQRVPTQYATAAEADPRLKALSFQSVVPTMGINPNLAPLDDKRVRQAIAHAVNRGEIIKVVAQGTGDLRPHWWTRGTWFDVESPDYEYSPEKAKALLAEAGHADGVQVTMSIIARQPDQQVAQLIQEHLRQVGITLDLRVLDRATWIAENTTSHNSQMILSQNFTYPDPNKAFAQDFANLPSNYVGWNDADSEALLALGAEAIATTDQARRRDLYQQAIAKLVDSAVYIAIGGIPSPDVAQNRLEGVILHANGEVDLRSAWLGADN